MHKWISRRRLVALTGVGSTIAVVGIGEHMHAAQAADPPDAAHGAGIIRILLINPNSSQKTTDMMVRIAQSATSDQVEIVGATAPNGPQMIIDATALAAAAPQVVEIGLNRGKDVSGIIIGAFGDPGFADLRRQSKVPVVGIAESAMLAASQNGRRFGIATTTPQLVASIDARAAELGVAKFYTGTRLTAGDPNKLVADPAQLTEALRQAVAECIDRDKAEAVIIGGGPLGNAAIALTPMFTVPVIAPIPEAVHRLTEILGLPRKA